MPPARGTAPIVTSRTDANWVTPAARFTTTRMIGPRTSIVSTPDRAVVLLRSSTNRAWRGDALQHCLSNLQRKELTVKAILKAIALLLAFGVASGATYVAIHRWRSIEPRPNTVTTTGQQDTLPGV